MLRCVGGRWLRPAVRCAAASLASAMIFGTPAKADEPAARPRANEICLFTSSNFEGLSSCIATGIGNAAIALILNDRVSSIRVGSAAAIEVCGDAFFGGWCQLYRSDVAELPAEQNNAITSYRVMTLLAADAVLAAAQTPPPPTQVAAATTPPTNGPAAPRNPGHLVPAATIITPSIAATPAPAAGMAAPAGGTQICFFAEPNFGGESFCALPKEIAGNVAAVWDDRISSIRIAGKVAVQVCQLRDFFGWCERIETSLAQLPAGRNDAISSFRLQ
jgi:hypothetical protein